MGKPNPRSLTTSLSHSLIRSPTSLLSPKKDFNMLFKAVLLSALLAIAGAADTTSSTKTTVTETKSATSTETKTATSTSTHHSNPAPMMTADAAVIGLGAMGVAAWGLL